MPPSASSLLRLFSRGVRQQTPNGPLRFLQRATSAPKSDAAPTVEVVSTPIPEITEVFPGLQTYESIHQFSLDHVSDFLLFHNIAIVITAITTVVHATAATLLL